MFQASWLVLAWATTSPFTETVIGTEPESSSVSIHGPIGVKPSPFLDWVIFSSRPIWSTAVTSLPMV